MTSHADITKVVDAYGDRLRASDAAGIVALYADAAAVMQPDLPTTVGKDQLAATYESAFTHMSLDFAFKIDEVLAGDGIAAVRTTGTGTITNRVTEEATPATFRELFVLRRDGSDWKIAQYMFQQMPSA